jgi:hypothetical protein
MIQSRERETGRGRQGRGEGEREEGQNRLSENTCTQRFADTGIEKHYQSMLSEYPGA